MNFVNAVIGYSFMGKRDVIDKAIGKLAVTYADQNEKDFEVLKKAVKSGKLMAIYDDAN